MSLKRHHIEWIIIAVMYLFYIIPTLVPFGLPIEVGEKASSFYTLIESLPEEPDVCLVFDYSPASYPIYQGLQEALAKHVFMKNGKIIAVAFSPNGPMMYKRFARDLTLLSQKTYGEDYVHLGFIPGGETGLASFMGDIRGTITTDFEGNSLDTLPIMQDINMATDFDFIFDMETGTTLGDGFVRQVASPYGTYLGLSGPGGQSWEPYYPDQVQALMYPLPDVGAQYEKLLRAPGVASKQLAVILLGNAFYIIMLVVANLDQVRERLM